MDDVLNMLTRRNLLYRIVPAPDRKLDVTVQLGTRDFPREAASNPSEFALRAAGVTGTSDRTFSDPEEEVQNPQGLMRDVMP